MHADDGALNGASALLSFTVENTISYQGETELSLAATRLAEKGVRRDLHLAGRKYPVGVLPAAGVFGANASGKSAILKSMADMRGAVLNSFRSRNGASSIYKPFALDPQTHDQPSSYAVDLVIDGARWQYGFEINDHRVLEEYAFYYPKGRQALVFNRTGDSLDFGVTLQSSDIRVLEKLLKEDALILSVVEATEDVILLPLFNWFKHNYFYITSNNSRLRILQTASMLQDEEFKNRLLSLIRLADLGITGIRRTEPDPDMADRFKRAIRILEGKEENTEKDDIILLDEFKLEHHGNMISVELEPDYESIGTLTWVSLIGPILDVLKEGSVLLIDELDASLHPDLVAVLINLFQDPSTNPFCAQIIFNAHDMTILNRHHSRLGRDQIWFTEKDSRGVSKLYSLAEFRTRKEEDTYNSYLKGRYGALPVLDLTELDRAMNFEPK